MAQLGLDATVPSDTTFLFLWCYLFIMFVMSYGLHKYFWSKQETFSVTWINGVRCDACGRRARVREGVVVCCNPKCLAIYSLEESEDARKGYLGSRVVVEEDGDAVRASEGDDDRDV